MYKKQILLVGLLQISFLEAENNFMMVEFAECALSESKFENDLCENNTFYFRDGKEKPAYDIVIELIKIKKVYFGYCEQ